MCDFGMGNGSRLGRMMKMRILWVFIECCVFCGFVERALW